MANLSVPEMVESERVLPGQFHAGVADSPERALMRAVLQRTINDLTAPRMLNYCSARGLTRLQREAAAWFLSGDETYIFSFVNICQILNLDIGAIRRALFQPRQEAA